mgnify:FL=1
MNLNITHHSTALEGSAYTDGIADRRGKLSEAEMNEAIKAQRQAYDEADAEMAARWESMKPAATAPTKPPPLPHDAIRAIWRGVAVVAVVLVAYGAFVAYLAGVTP